jgi:RNA polymerase sigma factor for flagellar operon FliA
MMIDSVANLDLDMGGLLPSPGHDPAFIQHRNSLILEYYPMVRRVAYRMARRFPRCVDAEDLVHIGLLGLIDAVDRFEPGRAQSFSSYARIRVQGAIVDEMRKNDWVPRSVRDRAARLDSARRSLGVELGREPTHEELALRLGVDTNRLEELSRTADVRVLVSTEECMDDDATLGESLSSHDDNLEEQVGRASTSTAVRGVVEQLPERERLIVELYYYRDLTFKEIADVLRVTESRVIQLHTRMKKRMEDQLQGLC